MNAWWRVLRGAWPYRWQVTISLLCALGVGLSYAGGVAVLLPVLKIFVSAEGVHGWVYRSATESRYHVQIWTLDTNIQKKKRGVIVDSTGTDAHEALRPEKADYAQILRVGGVDAESGGAEADSARWTEMVKTMAQAPDDKPLDLVVRRVGTEEPKQVQVPSGRPTMIARLMMGTVRWLPADRMTSLVYIVLFFIFLCVVGSIFRYWQQYIGMSVANRVVMDLRRRAYDRVVALPTSYFAQKGTSDLMSRLTQDTNTLTDGVSMAFGKAVQEPVKAVAAFGWAMWLDWKLCLMIVLTMPFLAIIIHKFSKRMRRASRRALESWSTMLAIINESLIGMRVVKAYSAEGYERRRFARVNKQLLKEQIKLNHYAALSRPTIETLAVAVSAVPMMFAANWVLNGGIDRDIFFTLLACFAAMLEPLRKLSDVNAKVQQTNAAATRVYEVLDMDREPNYSHNLPRLPRHKETIEFCDISFRYPGHDELVLQNVSLNVKHGQLVAVVGGNGSGKTTLLSLLPRLYTPTFGAILVDGVDIATVSLRSLRKQIGLVTQDTVLFADSVFNNIAYGTRHATREQVMEAAKRAYADEFIRNMPEGYETRVGEHGVRLSGGQKQRLAIARAILHDPAILILDEAMSQIDSDSEKKISLALKDFMQNRTTLMIAHRFQTVVSADLIIVLDKGRLVGKGTHLQLLSGCLAYRQLYETQFREVE